MIIFVFTTRSNVSVSWQKKIFDRQLIIDDVISF